MDDDSQKLAQSADDNNQVQMNLEEQCEDYLKLKEDMKEKSAQLKDMRENDPKWIECKDLQKKLKELRAEIQSNQDYITLKEDIAEMKDDRLMAERNIIALLKQKNIISYDYSHYDFQVEDKFKVKKREDNDENSKKFADFVKDYDKF